MFLVNDVLELSRVEEGGHEFELDSLDLRQATEAAIRSINLMAKEREITLTLEFDPSTPKVLMNEESIERVIINLLSNAIKYTAFGGNIKVAIHPEPDLTEVAYILPIPA